MNKLSRKALRASKSCAVCREYAQTRSTFASGDIFAQSHGGWDNWNNFKVMIVRAATLSTYSHVGVIEVDDSDGHVYAIEAVRPVVRRVLLSSIGDFYHLPLHKAQWTVRAKIFSRYVLGTKYSQWAAVKAFFRPLPRGSVNECAALTRELLLRCGVDLGPMSRPDTVVQTALLNKSFVSYIENKPSKELL